MRSQAAGGNAPTNIVHAEAPNISSESSFMESLGGILEMSQQCVHQLVNIQHFQRGTYCLP